VPKGCGSGYSTSRTCEIGLADHAGISYRSLAYLVDEAIRNEATGYYHSAAMGCI
jgi:D-lactate dehydrogenase